tara:strand:+ start:459 stop:599 length:141 start_codon:yes stop_codon:yes gene_type:complete
LINILKQYENFKTNIEFYKDTNSSQKIQKENEKNECKRSIYLQVKL